MNKNKIKNIDLNFISGLIEHKITPVVYGDQMLDKTMGCSIASTETTIDFLAKIYSKQNYQVRIIQLTNVDGVLDQHQKIDC